MTTYDDLLASEQRLILTQFLTPRHDDGAAWWRFYAGIRGKIVLEENPASSRPPTALEHALRPMFSYLHAIVSQEGSTPPPTTSAPSKAALRESITAAEDDYSRLVEGCSPRRDAFTEELASMDRLLGDSPDGSP